MTRSEPLRVRISAWSTRLGFEVLTTDSACEALKIKSRRRPTAAVIGDLGTSHSTLALARRMRSRESALASPPCILLAASLNGFPEPYDEMRLAGFSGVLPSPPTFDALKARLGAAGLLGGGAARRAGLQRREAEALFWGELEGDLSELQAALARRDAPDVARWAHRIKGASLMFGKDALGEVAAALEQRMTAGPSADLLEAARDVERLIALFLAHRGA